MVLGLDQKEWEKQAKKVWGDFLDRFPYEKLSSLALEEYCLGGGDKDNFSWWLEQGTKLLGSISGGSCAKFLIYKPKEETKKVNISSVLPQKPEEAFVELKEFLLSIARFARARDLPSLKEIENKYFGPAVFWKIAFLYQDPKDPWIYPVFSISAFRNLFKKSPKVDTSSQGQELLAKKYKDTAFWDASFLINDYLDNFLWISAQNLAVELGFEAVGGKDEGREETLKSQLFCHESGKLFLVTKDSKNLKIYTPSLTSELRNFLREEDVEVYEYSSQEERASFLNQVEDLRRGKVILRLTFRELSSFDTFLKAYIDIDEVEPLKGEPMMPPEVEEILKLLKFKKNVVLQGAPGTGKTFLVPDIVTAVCGKYPAGASREKVIEEFRKLQNEGRVIFCTFHPSFDYEDFVEGYKPAEDQEESSDKLTLEVRPGVIRRICEKISAKENSSLDASVPLIRDNVSVWKVSLCKTRENPLRDKCLDENFISIGYTEQDKDITDWATVTNGKSSLKAFYERMQKGDVVLSCYSSTETDAVGIITGEPEWDDDLGDYPRKRAVKWIYKRKKSEAPLNIEELNDGKQLTLSAIYELKFSSARLRQFLEEKGVLSKEAQHLSSKREVEPFVLVIDEINRGNVAKIFGELITLLESDKRKGQLTEVAITLPYSHTEFRLPPNLYILGTMNTADRSIGMMDYALRRRFAFFKVCPKKLNVPGFNSKLFEEVSSLFVSNLEAPFEPSQYLSPEYDPLDVWIGHSYFIETKEMPIAERFKYEILPILEEYLADGILQPHAKQRILEIKDSLAA